MLRSPKVKVAEDFSRYIHIPIPRRRRARFRSPYGAVNIRTVSEKSPRGSWLHPGLEPRDFFNKAVESLGWA